MTDTDTVTTIVKNLLDGQMVRSAQRPAVLSRISDVRRESDNLIAISFEDGAIFQVCIEQKA